MIEVTASALGAHPFLRGMPSEELAALAVCASHVRFPARHRIFEDGGYASKFWLIQSGYVTLDLRVPGEGLLVVETIGMGELLGCSWLFLPYRWGFGAVTVSPFEAFEFDAADVRACCAADPVLGGEFALRVAKVLAGRLQATRMKLLARSGPTANLY
jgi:CRP/FNR family transcriptional regulator, cyclic AMP receptor protein